MPHDIKQKKDKYEDSSKLTIEETCSSLLELLEETDDIKMAIDSIYSYDDSRVTQTEVGKEINKESSLELNQYNIKQEEAETSLNSRTKAQTLSAISQNASHLSFICIVCNRNFATSADLEEHLQKHVQRSLKSKTCSRTVTNMN